MIRLRWATWRHDLLVGLLASFLTAAVLVPVGWAAVRGQREQAESARQMAQALVLLARQQTAEADRQRDRAQRNLVDQAADFVGLGDRMEAEVFRVSTAAIAPEMPEGAHLLIDKKATSYAVGDIVVFRVEDKNYLGCVVAVEQAAGRLRVGRNGEEDRLVALSDVLGRGVLNTR
jgi:hypothetical protein